jgi:hypothetical protein
MLAAQQSHEGAKSRLHSQRGSVCPALGDFEDMYIDFYRFISMGAIVSSPVVDKGVVYCGSIDGDLYALPTPLGPFFPPQGEAGAEAGLCKTFHQNP